MESEIKYRRIFGIIRGHLLSDRWNVSSESFLHLCIGFGWFPDELIGKPASDIYVQPEDREKLLAELSRMILRDYEILMKKKDGTQTYESLMASILTDQDAEHVYFRTLRALLSVTVEKRRQQNFERMRKALRAKVNPFPWPGNEGSLTGSSTRVSDLARAIAAEMGLSIDGGFIHTASASWYRQNIHIPRFPATKLTDLEFDLIKTHSHQVMISWRHRIPLAGAWCGLQHHERMNGSGYPQGLRRMIFSWRTDSAIATCGGHRFHSPNRPLLESILLWKRFPGTRASFMMGSRGCLSELISGESYTLVLKSSW